MDRDAPHPAEHRDAAVDGVGRQPLHVLWPRTQAHRLALACEHLEVPVGIHGGDDEMERIGSTSIAAMTLTCGNARGSTATSMMSAPQTGSVGPP